MTNLRFGILVACIFCAGVSACQTTEPLSPVPYLARYAPAPSNGSDIAVNRRAAVKGQLVVENGCFMLVRNDGERLLLVTSDEASVVREGARWVVVGPAGQRLREGGDVFFTGGFASFRQEALSEIVPSACVTSETAGLDEWP